MFGVEKKGNTPDGADPHGNKNLPKTPLKRTSTFVHGSSDTHLLVRVGELTGQNTLIIRQNIAEVAKKFIMTTAEVDAVINNCKRILSQVSPLFSQNTRLHMPTTDSFIGDPWS
jgi:hypothetical protein